MTRNSLERRKVFFGRLASLSVIAFVVALALLSAACNNVNLAGEEYEKDWSVSLCGCYEPPSC